MIVILRAEREEDFVAVYEVNYQAFGQENESRLVEAIRKSDYFIPELSIVAEGEKGDIEGHILFSLIHIQTENALVPTIGLAPMAVRPSQQGTGIGSALVREGLNVCKQLGYEHVTVLGHPRFYPKFGFIPSVLKNIHPPFQVPEDVFMVIELKEGALNEISGKVVYPSAFETVS